MTLAHEEMSDRSSVLSFGSVDTQQFEAANHNSLSPENPAAVSASIAPPTYDTLEAREELAQIMDKERSTPLAVLGCLFVSWLIIFVTSLLKGGHGAQSFAGIKVLRSFC
jgi:hypothetical protein